MVVTTQYLRTRNAKSENPAAVCGRLSRIRASRAPIVPASKARKIAIASIRASSDSAAA